VVTAGSAGTFSLPSSFDDLPKTSTLSGSESDRAGRKSASNTPTSLTASDEKNLNNSMEGVQASLASAAALKTGTNNGDKDSSTEASANKTPRRNADSSSHNTKPTKTAAQLVTASVDPAALPVSFSAPVIQAAPLPVTEPSANAVSEIRSSASTHSFTLPLTAEERFGQSSGASSTTGANRNSSAESTSSSPLSAEARSIAERSSTFAAAEITPISSGLNAADAKSPGESISVSTSAAFQAPASAMAESSSPVSSSLGAFRSADVNGAQSTTTSPVLPQRQNGDFLPAIPAQTVSPAYSSLNQAAGLTEADRAVLSRADNLSVVSGSATAPQLPPANASSDPSAVLPRQQPNSLAVPAAMEAGESLAATRNTTPPALSMETGPSLDSNFSAGAQAVGSQAQPDQQTPRNVVTPAPAVASIVPSQKALEPLTGASSATISDVVQQGRSQAADHAAFEAASADAANVQVSQNAANTVPAQTHSTSNLNRSDASSQPLKAEQATNLAATLPTVQQRVQTEESDSAGSEFSEPLRITEAEVSSVAVSTSAPSAETYRPRKVDPSSSTVSALPGADLTAADSAAPIQPKTSKSVGNAQPTEALPVASLSTAASSPPSQSEIGQSDVVAQQTETLPVDGLPATVPSSTRQSQAAHSEGIAQRTESLPVAGLPAAAPSTPRQIGSAQPVEIAQQTESLPLPASQPESANLPSSNTLPTLSGAASDVSVLGDAATGFAAGESEDSRQTQAQNLSSISAGSTKMVGSTPLPGAESLGNSKSDGAVSTSSERAFTAPLFSDRASDNATASALAPPQRSVQDADSHPELSLHTEAPQGESSIAAAVANSVPAGNSGAPVSSETERAVGATALAQPVMGPRQVAAQTDSPAFSAVQSAFSLAPAGATAVHASQPAIASQPQSVAVASLTEENATLPSTPEAVVLPASQASGANASLAEFHTAQQSLLADQDLSTAEETNATSQLADPSGNAKAESQPETKPSTPVSASLPSARSVAAAQSAGQTAEADPLPVPNADESARQVMNPQTVVEPTTSVRTPIASDGRVAPNQSPVLASQPQSLTAPSLSLAAGLESVQTPGSGGDSSVPLPVRTTPSVTAQVATPAETVQQSAAAAAVSVLNSTLSGSSPLVEASASQASQSAAQMPAAVKAVSAVGGRGGSTATSRPVQAAGKSSSTHGAQASAAIPTSMVQDASALLRDPALVPATTRAENADAEAAGTAVSTPSTSDIFAALDSAPGASTPTWVHNGARQAEAGFHDPELGWVSVRADSSGGAVHASVVPGSDAAAQTLSGHLAGLNDYLTTHHSSVESLTLAAPEATSGSTAMNQNSNQNQGSYSPGQENAGQSGLSQSMNQGSGQGSSAERESNSVPPLYNAANSPAEVDSSGAVTPASASGGRYVSVMA